MMLLRPATTRFVVFCERSDRMCELSEERLVGYIRFIDFGDEQAAHDPSLSRNRSQINRSSTASRRIAV
jgi:hypothetical protein